mmetsp:Transcript_40036/g.78227  ORF Transcript_40036/g.78227 Transcript_40036/m.78227 type:complete len:86 (+) Transcript_40036:47-304(+)
MTPPPYADDDDPYSYRDDPGSSGDDGDGGQFRGVAFVNRPEDAFAGDGSVPHHRSGGRKRRRRRNREEGIYGVFHDEFSEDNSEE